MVLLGAHVSGDDVCTEIHIDALEAWQESGKTPL